MKILFSSDLHGNVRLYKELQAIAHQQKVDVLIFGGDISPKCFEKSVLIQVQEEFLRNWFRNYLNKFKQDGIKVYGITGNDDVSSLLPILEEFDREGLFGLLNGRLLKFEDFEIVGFPVIPASPFFLKDSELLDYDGMHIPHQLDRPVFSRAEGLEPIANVQEFLKIRGTIRQALELLPRPENLKKAIYVTHCPPSDLNLDVCADGKRVGSVSIRGFLKKMMPLVSLHGHAHESPRATSGIYHNNTAGWLAVQPGQIGRDVHAVLFDSADPVGTIRHTVYPTQRK